MALRTCRIRALVCVLALTASVAPLGAQSKPSMAQRPGVAAAIQVLDAWLQAEAAARDEPGLSIGLVYDQDLVWAKGYGLADRERNQPASPSTLYRIASVSKLFTSTAIMQLRDAGKLQLDDPVAKHLSWFTPTTADPDAPVITIRHLLTHTSGLPRELPLFYWNDLQFPSREEMMRLVPQLATILPPETQFKYSNLALAITGEIVAAVSGEAYPQYIEHHILRPLGMQSTRVTPDAATAGIAVGYRKRVPGQPRETEDFIDCRGLTPAANLASSVEDLAKFVSLQFRDGRAAEGQILKGSTLREMHRVQWLRPDWQSGQGLGFSVRRVGSQVRVGHDGAAPGYKSLVEFSSADKLGVIVLINGYDADPQFYVNQAFAIVGPAVATAVEVPKSAPVADPAWSNYVGTYTWKHVDVQVMVLNGELTMIVPDAANPWESRVRLAPIGPNIFKMAGGSNSGERVTFEVDETGTATKLIAGSYYRLRKPPAK
jgi:CubicO group peptidase (beta-lactamase class C family)